MTTEKRVINLFIEQLGEQVTPATVLVGTDIDSLDVVEMVMDAEETFDFDIPDSDMEALFETGKTVADVIAYVEQKLEAKR